MFFEKNLECLGIGNWYEFRRTCGVLTEKLRREKFTKSGREIELAETLVYIYIIIVKKTKWVYFKQNKDGPPLTLLFLST